MNLINECVLSCGNCGLCRYFCKIWSEYIKKLSGPLGTLGENQEPELAF